MVEWNQFAKEETAVQIWIWDVVRGTARRNNPVQAWKRENGSGAREEACLRFCGENSRRFTTMPNCKWGHEEGSEGSQNLLSCANDPAHKCTNDIETLSSSSNG